MPRTSLAHSLHTSSTPVYRHAYLERVAAQRSRLQHRSLSPAALSLALAAAFASTPVLLHANPSGGVAVQGTAAMVSNGNQLNITTTNGAGTSRSVINWQSFSIPQGSSTNFQQPSAASTSINRVVSNNPSAIFGTLSSNGKLVLVNPAGIAVGAGAVVDTAGFTAAVMNQSEADAKAGRMRFNADGVTGSLSVQGNIIARGGDVVLIAPNAEVAATAVVQAPGGTVALVAGQQVEITGRGLEGIQLQVTAPGNTAINLGTLKGDAVGIFAGTLKHSGLIQATGVTATGGRVLLSATSVAEVAGQITAQSPAQAIAAGAGATVGMNGSAVGSNGGSITVSADVAVLSGALSATGVGTGIGAGQGGVVSVQAGGIVQTGSIDVSGVVAGGSVGLSASRSLLQTADASVRADASDGTGGAVVLQAAASGGVLLSSAQVSANGAGTAGYGGTVQVLGAGVSLQAAQISADGDAGGGSIQVGGGNGGRDPLLPNSQKLYINGATQLSASARRRGDGGSVVLWSDGQTDFYGNVLALGAGAGGNGGAVEVSGQTGVQFGGTVSAAGGPGGANGSLLLDPKNITVAASTGGLGTLELTDPNPNAGSLFGSSLVALGGNSVLIADGSDNAGGAGAGAIYVFDKTTGALKSTLIGSHAGDQIGANCATTAGYGCSYVTGSALVFKSGTWSGGVGAWTFINSTATSGPSGVVSASNSLVGVTTGDLASANLVNNGSNPAVLIAPYYNGGRGAVANVDPINGTVGTLSSANALVGSLVGDNVGSGGYTPYGSTQWLLKSYSWNGAAGALTVINPSAIVPGTVSSANSLVGAAAGDNIGSGGIYSFSGGAVLVSSPQWGGGKGAFTVSSLASLSGTVTAANSLVGSSSTDGASVSVQSCIASNYCYGAIAAPYYNYSNFVLLNTNASGNGSLTLMTPSGSPTGPVTASNSLVGSTPGDFVGASLTPYGGGDALMVCLPNWNNSTIVGAGALTFSNLGSMATGAVGAGNSIVGTATGDLSGISVLTYGSYADLNGQVLLLAPNYGGGAIGTGAVRLVTLPVTGSIASASGTLTSANALVGSTPGDHIGSGGVDTSQQDYWMIKSPSWNNGGTMANAGAVTFFEPALGTLATGSVSGYSNSWVGGAANDAIGSNTALVIFSNDNGLLINRSWGGGAGAITLIADLAMPYGTISSSGGNNNSYFGSLSTDGAGMQVQAFNSFGGTYSPTGALVSNQYWNGNRGFVTYVNQDQNFATLASPGSISANNSLVGKQPNEYLGSGGIFVLPEASQPVVAVSTPGWGNGSVSSAGAYTFFNATVGAGTGSITSGNSILGDSVNALSSSTLYTDQYNYAYTAPTGQAVLVAPSYASGAGALLMFNLTAPTVGASAYFGSAVTDHIGSGGIQSLSYSSGGFILKSPSFGSGAGALTYGDGNNPTSFTQFIGGGNSLVGNTTQAALGGASTSVTEYSTGKLLVLNTAGAGSITLVQNPSAMVGTISNANSLLGSTTGDLSGATVFNDYYTAPYTRLFITMPNWDNGTLTNAGAITALDVGSTLSPSGVISATNSLVGSSANDRVGSNGITINSDGYVIYTPSWSSGVGALSFFGVGASAPTGTIAAGNSLLGTTTGDLSSYNLLTYGGAGKRIFSAPNYGGGAGAVALVDFANSGIGTLNSGNALVGSSVTEHVGSGGITAIGNAGLYAIGTPSWSSGAGSLKLFNPSAGILAGTLSAANSLVGAASGDQVGVNVYGNYTSFANGKLLLISPTWGGGLGAITLVQNPSSASGVINASNSLVGVVNTDGASFATQGYDDNGQTYAYYYPPTHVAVYNSSFNGGRGMVSVIDSSLTTSPSGVISSANSLVGAAVGDTVGSGGLTPTYGLGLQISSPNWNGARGALTVSAFTAPLAGTISSANSLVGSSANDRVGTSNFSAITLGTGANLYSGYYLQSSYYGGGLGAVSFLNTGALTGVVSSANSVIGTVAGSGGYASTGVVADGSVARVNFYTGTGRVLYVDPRSSGNAGYTGGLGFADNPGADATISAQSITSMTNAGTNVLLQANNDIFVNAAITSAAATGVSAPGQLQLEAGRSVFVNANIDMGGGGLNLIANSQLANAAYRDAGAATLATASGVSLASSGAMVGVLMDSGTGGDGGSISLGNVVASGLELRNWSTTANASILQQGGTSWQSAALRMETKAQNGNIGSSLAPITFGASWLALRTQNGGANLVSTASALAVTDVTPNLGSGNGSGNRGGPSTSDPRKFDDIVGLTLGGNGSLSLTAAGDLSFAAQNAALSVSAQNLSLQAKSISLKAGTAPVNVGARGALSLASAGNITLQGGSAAGAYAAVLSPNGPLLVTAQAVSLAAGTGLDADAVIGAPNARALLATFSGNDLGSTNPLGDGKTQAGYWTTSSSSSPQSIAADLQTLQNADLLSTFITLWTADKKRAQQGGVVDATSCSSGG